jgi:hypothetical protein
VRVRREPPIRRQCERRRQFDHDAWPVVAFSAPSPDGRSNERLVETTCRVLQRRGKMEEIAVRTRCNRTCVP